MKKIISIVLTLSMLLSFMCFTQAGAVDSAVQGGFNIDSTGDESGLDGALENFNPDLISISADDVFKLLNEGKFNGIETLFSWSAENSKFSSEVEYVIDFLYNSSYELMWATQVTGEDGFGIKGDIALSLANANVHLRRILNQKYGGQNLFLKSNNPSVKDVDDYATAIASFIYNLLYPTNGEYKKIEIEFPGTQTVSDDTFYGTIVEKSGLDDVLQHNWCNQPYVNFKTVLNVIGVDLDNVLASEFLDGFRLGKKIIEHVITKFLNVGPINYFLDLIWAYSRAYNIVLYEPTMALLNMKVSARVADTNKPEMTVEDLKSLTGLANFIFNDFDNADTTKLQFMCMPIRRFGMAKDTTELFLMLFTYFNFNSRVANNAELLKDNSALKAIFGSDAVGAAFYSSTFLANYQAKDGTATNLAGFIESFSAMYQETLDNAPTDIFNSIKRTLEKIFKFIVDYFDNLFKLLTGEKEFGQA